MKLKRIEMQGFKSFVDRTNLEIAGGITAILGPNGCGKSNIVDAVRWVLGEQSPKTLRGDRMEDVIFKGTTKRKPVGLAEVSLTFDNADRRLSIEFDEVCIKRKVTRDGGSDYFLNGSLCRLKDLRNLFYDSGVNNASYSIIEQSMINTVLDEHTQELRRLIEEGSGITKYKARRKETQRKLEHTQQDLLRLNDIIEEIDREVRSLRYQVGKARRHQKLFHQIRGLDLMIASRVMRDFSREETKLRKQLDELKAMAEADSGELASLRAQIEAVRPTLDERQAERRQLEEARQAYEEELQETERQVLLVQHRIEEYERRLLENRETLSSTRHKQAEVRNQIEEMLQHSSNLGSELEQANRDLELRHETFKLLEARLDQDRHTLEEASQLNLEFIETDAAQQSHLRELEVKQENRQERLAVLAEADQQLQKELATVRRNREREAETVARLRDRRRDLLQEMARLEREESDQQAAGSEIQEDIAQRAAQREAVSSRLDLLKKLQQEYEGYSQGARHLLQEHAGDGRILGGLAEQFQVEPEFTAAFETLFRELLDAVVVDGTSTAVDLVAELRRQGSGRASFLCGNATGTTSEIRVPSAGRPAREVVRGPALDIPYMNRVLGATAIFDDDSRAVAAAVDHDGPWPLICLSRSGLLVTSDGVVRGGRSKAEETGLLGRGEQLEKLTAEIAGLDRQITTLRERRDNHHQRFTAARQQLARNRSELSVLDEDLSKLHGEMGQHQSRCEVTERRLSEMDQEKQRLATEFEELKASEAALRGQLAESGRQRSDSTMRLDEQRQSVTSLEQQRDVQRAELEEMRLQRQRLEGRRRESETALAHLRQTLAELSAQQERLGQEIELSQSERESLRVELTERRSLLDDGIAEREKRRQLVQAATDAIQGLHDRTAGWHERVNEIEDKRTSCREQMHVIDTQLATMDVRRNNLQERIAEHYEGEFTDLVQSIEPEHIPRELERDGDVFQLEQAQELLADRRGKLNHLGPVNHLALEEFEAKKERLEFLEKQRADVEKAKEDLTTAIAHINRTARRLFSDTFEEVRRNFIAVFKTLFEGGRADLQLIRTDDPLESNIHILAQPRGKVVNHVTLLSGGERCLTALSLLFAVYLVKPSPFCMLDEVDAPLDDSNIQRFVKMLQEFSGNTQFMVVTHNKLTMETANHLYGVTMLEHGCSSIVSVTFSDVAETQSDSELGQAIATRRRELDRRESVKAILSDEDTDSAVRFTLAGGGLKAETGSEDGSSSPAEQDLDSDAHQELEAEQ